MKKRNPKSQEKKKLTKEERRKKRIKSLLIKLSVFVIVLFVLLHYVVAVRIVHNNDMFPFFTDGQLVISYRLGKIGVNQAVLYEYDGQEKFGRIVAQEGDQVTITSKEYLINGNASYTANPYPTTVQEGKEISLTVPKDSYFILNDYRERETDSRTFGCVSHIIGPIIFSLKYREF